VICAFAIFALLDTKSPLIIITSIAIVVSLTHAVMFAPQAAFLPELFGTRTRYSGASLGCQIAAAISGGLAPIIATGLLGWSGQTWPISLYLVALAVITLGSALVSTETYMRDL